MASAQGSTGVDQDRGMCEEKRIKMNRFSIIGTLNSGGPECVSKDAERNLTDDRDQPTEDAIRTFRESDPPIVVRDGNAGHKAKEWAGSNASNALTTGHVDPDHCVTLPACNGNWLWHSVSELVSNARFLRSPVR
jgi:hypothetical protein